MTPSHKLCLALILGVSLSSCRLRQSEAVNSDEAGGPCPSAGTIEDAEDGDAQIVTAAGRGGYVYTYVDKAGSSVSPGGSEFAPVAGGANDSQKAVRISGA